MRYWASKFFFIIIFGVLSANTAWADDNNQHLKQLYQSYKTALDNREYRLALAVADDAWKASEDTLGMSKQTGDFAYNYAVLGQKLAGDKRNKKVETAFKRSLELVNLHGEETAIHTLRRQLGFGVYWAQTGKRKKARSHFEMAENLAQSAGLTDVKTYATLLHAKSMLAYQSKQYAAAETSAISALQLMDDLGRLNTKAAYRIIYSRALAQSKLEKWREAIDGFGKIHANLDRVLPKTDRMIGRAYLQESRAVQLYTQANSLKYSELGDIYNCSGCWPNFDLKYTGNLSLRGKYKIERQPPIMPKYAHGSGVVALMYDTDDNGKPVNIRIIDRSAARIFDRPSIDAIKTWKVSDKLTGLPAKGVEKLVTIMTFRLTDRSGNLLDFYGRPIEK